MKNNTIIALLLLCFCNSGFAQNVYKQVWFNHPAGQYRNERFEDGLRTINNFSVASPYYLTAVGATNTANGATADRMRFVRMDNASTIAPAVNRSYAFNDVNNVNKFSCGANSLAEINALGNNGGYMIAGYVRSFGAAVVPGGGDALLCRMSNAGAVANPYRIDFDGGKDEAMCIKRSGFVANRWLVCGHSSYTAGGITRSDVWVMRVQSNGTIDWVARFNTDPTAPNAYNGTCQANYLAEDAATGDIYVAGSVRDDAAGAITEGLVFKLGSGGAVSWILRYSDPLAAGSTEFHSIKKTADGNYVLAGFSSENGGAVTSDMLIAKITPAGAVIWDNLLRINNGAAPVAGKAFDLFERQNGAGQYEYFLSGSTVVGGVNTQQAVYKTDGAAGFGLGLEHYLYNPTGTNEHGYAIDQVPTGVAYTGFVAFSSIGGVAATPGITNGYFARGYFNGCVCTDNCPAVAKTDVGIGLVPNVLNYSSKDLYTRVVLQPASYNCIATTLCEQPNIGPGVNFKTDEEESAGEVSPAIGADNAYAATLTVYPNPLAGDVLHVRCNCPMGSVLNVQLTDIAGRVITDFGQHELGEGEEVQLPPVTIIPGMYLLQMTDQEGTITAKRIVKK